MRDLFNAVFQSAIQAIIVIDAKGEILQFNPAAEKMFGYEAADILGHNVTRLMPRIIAEQHDNYLQDYLNTGEANIIGQGREVTAVTQAGEQILCFLSISHTQVDGADIFIGLFHDLEELHKARDNVRVLEENVAKIAKIQQMYIDKVDQHELFDYILKFLLEFTNSEYGFIGPILVDSENQRYLKTYALTNIAWNDETQAFYEKNAPKGLEFRNLNTLFGHTIRTGEHVLTNDPMNHLASGGLPDGHPDLNSYLGIPIYGNSGLTAMIGIANREGGFDESVLVSLKPIINTIASIVEANTQAEQLRQLAQQDSLTGLANRKYFHDIFQLQLNHVKRYGGHLALLLLDLNKFKLINDSKGHAAGDEVLRIFAHKLIECVRPTDTIARLGGDEFAILVTDLVENIDAGRVAQRITDALAQPVSALNHTLTISASIGIADLFNPILSQEQLMKNADYAMYQSKRDGNFHFYTPALEADYNKFALLESLLPAAIEQRQLNLIKRPLITLHDGSVAAQEMLVQFTNERIGDVEQSKILTTVEQMGLAASYNEALLQQVICSDSAVIAYCLAQTINNWETHLKTLATIAASQHCDQCRVLLLVSVTTMSMICDSVSTSCLDELTGSAIQLCIYDFQGEFNQLWNIEPSYFHSLCLSTTTLSQHTDQAQQSLLLHTMIDYAKLAGVELMLSGLARESEFASLTTVADILHNSPQDYDQQNMPNKR